MAASFYTKYKVLCKIGEGSFSEVLKCQDRATEQQYAAKRLRNNYRSAGEAAEIPETVAARKLTPHPNVLQLLEHHFDPCSGSVTLIFELMDMSLYDLLKARTRCLPEARVRSFLYQLLRGCEHLHRHGIFHRDVKPENILVKGDCVKLGDLGSIRGSYSKPPYTEYISTRWYRSPECLLTAGFYGPKMDIWAVGCVFYETYTLKALFPGSNEMDQLAKIHGILGTPHPRLLAKMRRHQSRAAAQVVFPPAQGCGLAPLLPSLSESGRDLLRLTLIYDPDQRAHARRLLRHSYFVDLRDLRDLRECSSAASSTSSVCARRSWQGQAMSASRVMSRVQAVGSGGDRTKLYAPRISLHRGCSTVEPAPGLRAAPRPAPRPGPGPRLGPRTEKEKQRSCSTSFLPLLPPARRATLHSIPEAPPRKARRPPDGDMASRCDSKSVVEEKPLPSCCSSHNCA